MVLQNWYVYIIECRDKELYVGIAKDTTKRVAQHNKGLACRYTKFRNLVKLLYQEQHLNYSSARKRESELKKFSREKKLALLDPSASVSLASGSKFTS